MPEANPEDLTKRWFDMIMELAALSEKQLALAPKRAPTEQKSLLAWALFMRGVSSLQSATLLAEHSFVTDCGTISRSVVETTFSLGALVAGYDLAENVSRANVSVRRKIASEMLSLPQDLRPQGHVAEGLRAFLAESEDEKGSLQFKILADKAGLSSVYTVMYRSLSDKCAHPTINSLERQLIISDDQPVAFSWGPRLLGRISALQWISACYLYLLRFMQDLLPSDEISAGMNDALSKYSALSEVCDKARAFDDDVV